MVFERLRLNVLILAVFVSLSTAQYFPQQQYYWPQQQQQQSQYYWPQQQQQQQYYPQQLPQQTIIYQQPQASQQFVAQPQQSIVQPSIYREQLTQPKISKPTDAFDLPPPPSRFLPDGGKIIHRQNNNNNSFRRGGSINNRRPIASFRQLQPSFQQPQQQPQRRVDVVHTRAPPTTAKPIVAPRRPITVATTPLPPRTRSSTPAVSHLSSTRNPNTYFLDCCKNKKVAKSCESRCNFDILSKKILTGMFLGSDVCPQRHGLDLFSCAAQDGDHRECCRGKNVQRTGAGDKCLNFCKMTPDSHFQADASYLPCWAVLNDIKSCFKEAIINGHTL